DEKEGLHIPSMAGTWLAIVEGFAGVRVRQQQLSVNPLIPGSWEMYSFMMRFKNKLLRISISKGRAGIENLSGTSVTIKVSGMERTVEAGKKEIFTL
ncbi:MAG: glycosyl hydrolase family 65 protein, partial [Bacteroidales bacterium]